MDFGALAESLQYFPVSIFLLTKNKQRNKNKTLTEQGRVRDMEDSLFKKIEHFPTHCRMPSLPWYQNPIKAIQEKETTDQYPSWTLM